MDFRWTLAIILAFLVGASLAWLAKGAAAPAPAEAGVDAGLVDGKYLVFQNDYGNWVYERSDEGFKRVIQELTPLGLSSIWNIQKDYKPAELKTAKGEILYVSSTSYSAATGSFNVNYRFYEHKDDKLVEIPMERAAAPAAPPR